MLELWWPRRAAWAGQRLFRAGYLDRFRPVARRGSFPWTYRIERDGLQLLKEAGVVERRERYEHRAIYDYVYVLHEVQCNGWVIAWRRLLGESLLGWWGESAIEPPQGLRAERPLTLGVTGTVEGLRDARPRLLRPDAVVETLRSDGERVRTLLIEYDRTGRPDKNLEKLRRYDAFLTWWWRYSVYQDAGPPFVIFVCQNEQQRDRFLAAGDNELTGYHCYSSADG